MLLETQSISLRTQGASLKEKKPLEEIKLHFRVVMKDFNAAKPEK